MKSYHPPTPAALRPPSTSSTCLPTFSAWHHSPKKVTTTSHPRNENKMASRVAARRLFSTTMRRMGEHEKQELKKETKRNPELMVRHIHDQLLSLPPLHVQARER